MKTPIPAIEKVIAERANSTEENINIRLFWAYKHSLEAGNDLINFYDIIWKRDIEGIVDNLNFCAEYAHKLLANICFQS